MNVRPVLLLLRTASSFGYHTQKLRASRSSDHSAWPRSAKKRLTNPASRDVTVGTARRAPLAVSVCFPSVGENKSLDPPLSLAPTPYSRYSVRVSRLALHDCQACVK